MRELFAAHHIEIDEDIPERLAEDAYPRYGCIRGHILSPHLGRIGVTYRGPTGHRGIPCLFCQLLDWPDGASRWFGFDHWKQNLMGSTSESPETFRSLADWHLGRFDAAQLFPAPASSSIGVTVSNPKGIAKINFDV